MRSLVVLTASRLSARRPAASRVPHRLARLRAAVRERSPGYDPAANPLQQFGKHHTDWGGFGNQGTIAN